MNQDKIGKFISSKRKEKNMTQRDLANIIGVTDRAVSKWERGVGCPDISLLDDLSKALNISIVELLKGEEIVNVKIDEKDIIESMKYSKEITKNKIKLIINTLLITIILITSFILMFLNIRNIIFLNKKYNNYFESSKISNESIINFDNYYNIILNNQGKYDNEDYEKIIRYVNKTKERLNDKTKEYLLKEKVNMNDYREFYKYYYSNLIENYESNKTIYSILLKYDLSKENNMIKYYRYYNFSKKYISNIYDRLYHQFDYKKLSLDFPNIFSCLKNEFDKEEMLLKDIIEVGELDV